MEKAEIRAKAHKMSGRKFRKKAGICTFFSRAYINIPKNKGEITKRKTDRNCRLMEMEDNKQIGFIVEYPNKIKNRTDKTKPE